jgi:hypothetical protein
MNQDMHVWVAMVLVALTVMMLHRKDFFIKIEDEHSFIIFCIQIIMPIIFFGIWLYRIS